MGYINFLSGLFEEGRGAVSKFAPLPDEAVRSGDEFIAKYELVYRSSLPGDAPRFVAPAARWAAISFFRACQFAVYREVAEPSLKQEFDTPFSATGSPDVHYSVDMIFRYLPDLNRFAGSAAEHDPLLGYLNQWAMAWPLSSVGMDGIGEVKIDGFAECPSLMQLYADRVIVTGDESRLMDPRVREVVQMALGMFPSLDERIGEAMKKYAIEEIAP